MITIVDLEDVINTGPVKLLMLRLLSATEVLDNPNTPDLESSWLLVRKILE